MHGYGGGRVIRSLLSYPCGLGTKAIISTLPEKLKQDVENELYREYISECLRMLTESTAKIVSNSYMSVSYYDIINPKAKDNRTAEEIVIDVITKAGLEVV